MDQSHVTPETIPNSEINIDRCLLLQTQARLTVMGRIGEHVPRDTPNEYLMVCAMLAKGEDDGVKDLLRALAEADATDRRRYLATQIAGTSEDETDNVDGLPRAFMRAMDAYADSREHPHGEKCYLIDHATSTIIDEHGGADLMSEVAHGIAGYGYKGTANPQAVVEEIACDATESLLPGTLAMPEAYPDIEAAMSRYALSRECFCGKGR